MQLQKQRRFWKINYKKIEKVVDGNQKYDIISNVHSSKVMNVYRITHYQSSYEEGTEGRSGVNMSNVIVKENETLDSALRRFKRSCAKAGIQQEIRKREHYEKPSVKRKKKSEAARKRKYN